MAYAIWIDYGWEGWSPFECKTIAECLNHLISASGQGYRITRDVELTEHIKSDSER